MINNSWWCQALCFFAHQNCFQHFQSPPWSWYFKSNHFTFQISTWVECALRPQAVVWYCATTDQGSSEAAARKRIQHEVASLPQVIFLDTNCLEHQVHLSVRAALSYIDDALKEHQRGWRYYSSVAIFSSCARDLAGALFEKWWQVHGAESALKTVRTLIPKSNAGRWGCMHDIEERFLRAPQPSWAICLNHVILEKLDLDSAELACLKDVLPNDVHRMFASKAPKSKKKSDSKIKIGAAKGGQTDQTGHVDILAIEQMAEHAARIGKWRRHLLLTINDKLFGRLVEAMHVTRSPLIHCSNFLKQDLSDEDLLEKGNKLHQLICYKAEELRMEFDDILSNSAFPVPSFGFQFSGFLSL